MSDKKIIAELKPEDRKLLKSVIDTTEKILKVEISPNASSQKTEKPEKTEKSHQDADFDATHLFSCPGCNEKQLKKLHKEIEKRGGLVECEGCGSIVGRNDPTCFKCGGTKIK